MPAVSIRGVSKKYRIFPSGRDRLKEVLSFGKKKYGHDFWALKDIDLEVEPGTTLGILGRNGAGKSTLLNTITGVLRPTSGTVEVNGRLIATSGFGAGFNQEFSGRENIMLNGLILGIERREMLERFDDIAAFADIGEFMDQPIKTYSSGMRSRLGFAVAVNVEPDVLILDETLAVGDAVYKQVALQKMYELRDSGTTILFVSHSTSMVEEFCTEAILLHKGRKVAAGETTEVIDQYQALVSSIKEQRKNRRTDGGQPPGVVVVPDGAGEDLENRAFKKGNSNLEEHRAARLLSDTGEVRIQSVELLDERLLPVTVVAPDSTVAVRVHLEYLKTVKDSELSITLRNKAGLEVFSTSTTQEGTLLRETEKGERMTIDFIFKVPLQPGLYSVTAAARTGNEGSYLDQVEAATTFEITLPQGQNPFRGVVHLPTEVRIRGPEVERQGRSA